MIDRNEIAIACPLCRDINDYIELNFNGSRAAMPSVAALWPRLDNVQTHFIASSCALESRFKVNPPMDCAYSGVDETFLARAMQNLDKIKILGTLDDLEGFLAQIYEAFGVAWTKPRAPRANIRNAKHKLTPRAEEILRNELRFDIALYEEVKKRSIMAIRPS